MTVTNGLGAGAPPCVDRYGRMTRGDTMAPVSADLGWTKGSTFDTVFWDSNGRIFRQAATEDLPIRPRVSNLSGASAPNPTPGTAPVDIPIVGAGVLR
ncbi:MAG: hypothetical protein Q8O67_01965 [Deltaproteobacteria bacterium]|nr:hypothetical protein [Deltaproteobacteria bacterium]